MACINALKSIVLEPCTGKTVEVYGSLNNVASSHPSPNWQMQPLSPGRWDPTVCPRSSRVLAGPGVLSCPKICPALQPDSPGGSGWSVQAPTASLLLFPLTPILPSAGQPQEPHSQQEDTLALFWQLLPAANSRGWGQPRL